MLYKIFFFSWLHFQSPLLFLIAPSTPLISKVLPALICLLETISTDLSFILFLFFEPCTGQSLRPSILCEISSLIFSCYGTSLCNPLPHSSAWPLLLLLHRHLKSKPLDYKLLEVRDCVLDNSIFHKPSTQCVIYITSGLDNGPPNPTGLQQ